MIKNTVGNDAHTARYLFEVVLHGLHILQHGPRPLRLAVHTLIYPEDDDIRGVKLRRCGFKFHTEGLEFSGNLLCAFYRGGETAILA